MATQEAEISLKKKSHPKTSGFKSKGYLKDSNNFFTGEDYDSLLQKQEQKCADCSKSHDASKAYGSLYVDHDHNTGIVRNLVCSSCNSVRAVADAIILNSIEKRWDLIAMIQYHTPKRILAAADILEKWFPEPENKWWLDFLREEANFEKDIDTSLFHLKRIHSEELHFLENRMRAR